MDGKVGLAMLETGKYAKAVWRLSSGLECSKGAAALPLQIGLCKAYLLTNEPSKAEALAADIVRVGLSLPEILAVRGVAAFLLGKHEQAEQYVRQARTLSHSRDVALMLELLDIELALVRGEKVDLPSGADSAQPFLAAWIHLVRGKLRQARGKEAEARASYHRALELDKVGFVGASARHLLSLAPSDEGPKVPTNRDPAVERKKKRR
jgi:tetratricopeptide (TPR) repeat protein